MWKNKKMFTCFFIIFYDVCKEKKIAGGFLYLQEKVRNVFVY